MNVVDKIKELMTQIKSLWGAITDLQESADSSASHDLLSAVHPDTDPDSPVAGDIIIADNTPEWARLPKGSNGQVLKLDTGLPAWATCPITAHDLLSTPHGDTTAAAVQRGDMVVGKGASPKWERLAKGTSAQVLTMGADEPAWATPSTGGGSFIDNFADASRHWGWYDHQTSAAKTITEAGGVLTIAVSAGTTTDWWSAANSCPKCVTGFPGFPCEIITKLSITTVNDKVIAGMFVGGDCLGFGADYAVYFGRSRDDGTAKNGLFVESLGTRQYTNAVLTNPIWLKILVTGDSGGSKMTFFYSTDGISYTDTALVYVALARTAGMVAGLFVKNWSGNAISAEFEFFTMTVSGGPG